jgi:hypothetical protein
MAHRHGERNGTVFQSGLKRNLPSGQAKPSCNARCRNPAGSRSSVRLELGSVPQPELLQRPVDQLARAHVEARMLGAEAAARPQITS